LSHHLKEETILAPGPGGTEELFIVDGFSMIIEGDATKVLSKRLPALLSLSFFTNLLYLLPPSQNKVSLLASVLMGYLLSLKSILERTPKVVVGFHYLFAYAYYCYLFIIFAFAEFCIVLFLHRILPNHFTEKVIRRIDLVFFVLNWIAYLMFNGIYWFYNPLFPPNDICHNSDRFDINCKT